jgi:hypothetical protein
MTYPTPTPAVLRAAFADHGVNFVSHPNVNTGRDAWTDGLRAATVHHTAGKNSADYLASFRWGGANVVINNGSYNGTRRDGRAVILCWGSAWHSGKGGPWPGVAGKDSLHLVSWGIEIESLGDRRDITVKQETTVGQMLAALVQLGMPIEHVHTHANWTDGDGPVGGYPLTTLHRKIDTRADLGYDAAHWVAAARAERIGLWDGYVPADEAIYKAEQTPGLHNPAAWRVACRLFDLGYWEGDPPVIRQQGYPVKAVAAWQYANGWHATSPGKWGPKASKLLFG